MEKEKVSIVLPVYNEEAVLDKNVKRLISIFDSALSDYEIIISEDGSTDRTVKVAQGLQSGKVLLFHSPRRLGKGAAIKSACGYAKGDIIIFMDADLASNPNQVIEQVRLIENGADMVIGSRYLKGSKASRSPIRYFASKSFNWLVRALLGSHLSDHQCGFKAFRKKTVLPIINEVEDERWFWDTELLVRAQKKGLVVAEMPIEWKESPQSKFRLVRDSMHMGWSLVKFKLRHL